MSHQSKNKQPQRPGEPSPHSDSTATMRVEDVREDRDPPVLSNNSGTLRKFSKIVFGVIILIAVVALANQVMAEDVVETGDVPIVEETEDVVLPDDEGQTPELEADTSSFFDDVSAWFADKEEAAKEVDEKEAALAARQTEVEAYATKIAEHESDLLLREAQMADAAEHLKSKANAMKQCVVDALSGM